MKSSKEKYPKVQKIINKLISEEWLAGNMYKMFSYAIDRKDACKVASQFIDIAADELNDHMDGLIKAAFEAGFEVPCSYKEYCRHASDNAVKQFENIKRNGDAEHFIEQSIKAELDAIESYQQVIEEEDLDEFPLIKMQIVNNMYDEVEHLQTFKFMSYVDDLGIAGEIIC